MLEQLKTTEIPETHCSAGSKCWQRYCTSAVKFSNFNQQNSAHLRNCLKAKLHYLWTLFKAPFVCGSFYNCLKKVTARSLVAGRIGGKYQLLVCMNCIQLSWCFQFGVTDALLSCMAPPDGWHSFCIPSHVTLIHFLWLFLPCYTVTPQSMNEAVPCFPTPSLLLAPDYKKNAENKVKPLSLGEGLGWGSGSP